MDKSSTAMDDDIADEDLQRALRAAVEPADVEASVAVKEDQPCLS